MISAKYYSSRNNISGTILTRENVRGLKIGHIEATTVPIAMAYRKKTNESIREIDNL